MSQLDEPRQIVPDHQRIQLPLRNNLMESCQDSALRSTSNQQDELENYESSQDPLMHTERSDLSENPFEIAADASEPST